MGVLLFFFPRLETKKTQEGKKCEKKPQIQARDAQHFQNTGLPQCPSNSSVSGAFFPPSEWLPPVLPLSLPCQFQQHRSLSLAAAARAGLCCVLSSCCIQLPDGFSSHLPGGGRRAQSSPPLWPGTASLSRTDQGQTNCPHGLGAAEPLAEPLWPNSVKPLQAHHAQGQLCWGSTPEPATRMFQTLPNPSLTPLGHVVPVS